MVTRLQTPFGVEWDALDLPALLAFLDEGQDESLTWEAKGGDISRHHIRKAASGFANSERGGVLVLGVTREADTGRWVPDGWVPPEPELDLWISHCLGDGGVNPRPSTRVKPWALEAGGWVACVAIWPVATPPVITSSGQIWERTSGETVPVRDPVALRRLFERGRAAESRIHGLSQDAVGESFVREMRDLQHSAVLAFAAASVPSEVGAMIFRESYFQGQVEPLLTLARARTADNLRGFVRAASQVNQGGFTIWSHDGFGHGERCALRVGRDGRVAVAFSDNDMNSGADWLRYSADELARMWYLARTVLNSLGAIGVIHVRVLADAPNGPLGSAQWSDMDSDGADELPRLVRDIARGLGHIDWEPEG